MPLDTQLNNEAPKVYVFPSKIMELLALVRLLAESVGCEKYDERIEPIRSGLQPDSIRMLGILFGFKSYGLEFTELVLRFKMFDNVELFIDTIAAMDETDFLYGFFGDELTREEILAVKSGAITIDKLKERNPSVAYSSDAIGIIFYDTKNFRSGFLRLIDELDGDAFRKRYLSMSQAYEESLSRLKSELGIMTPLDLAQAIMGKKFRRVSDYESFYFIPSGFIHPPQIRFFNEKTNILIYNLHVHTFEEVHPAGEILDAIKAIGDRTRLEILRVLCKDMMYGKTLSDKMNLNTATISHHLNELKQAGLIDEIKVKHIKYYKTNIEHINKLFKGIVHYLMK